MKSIPNFKDYKITKNGNIFGISGQQLTPRLHSAGYLTVNLRRKYKYIHRLVLETFKGPCPKGMECNHKDGNKQNNKLSNLEWITRKENIKHARKLGLFPLKHKSCNKGQNNGMAKLKNNEVWLIKRLLKAKIKQKFIGKMFNIAQPTVSAIKSRNRWK